MLEFGDRVGVLTPPEHKQEIRRHFGDTAKATAELSYVSLGIGMVMGILLGLVPIPVPGLGVFTLGMAGGPLVVALMLGKLRRTGPLLWVMPVPANIVLCNLGLALFLAAIGINAGQPFVRAVSASGLTMLLISVAILLTTVLIVLLVGRYLMKIPRDGLVDVVWGVTRSPIPVHFPRATASAGADTAYAMILPTATIVNVVAVQIAGLVIAAGAG
jgi:putative transport protein